MQIGIAWYMQTTLATQRKAMQIAFIYACNELNCRNSRVALNDLKRAKQESFVVTLQRCFCSFVELLCKTTPHKVIDNAPKAKQQQNWLQRKCKHFFLSFFLFVFYYNKTLNSHSICVFFYFYSAVLSFGTFGTAFSLLCRRHRGWTDWQCPTNGAVTYIWWVRWSKFGDCRYDKKETILKMKRKNCQRFMCVPNPALFCFLEVLTYVEMQQCLIIN